MAHLYYLREVVGADAYLLFVCITDAPDVRIPASRAQWQGALAAIECALGLGDNPFRKYIGHLFWAAPKEAA